MSVITKQALNVYRIIKRREEKRREEKRREEKRFHNAKSHVGSETANQTI